MSTKSVNELKNMSINEIIDEIDYKALRLVDGTQNTEVLEFIYSGLIHNRLAIQRYCKEKIYDSLDIYCKNNFGWARSLLEEAIGSLDTFSVFKQSYNLYYQAVINFVSADDGPMPQTSDLKHFNITPELLTHVETIESQMGTYGSVDYKTSDLVNNPDFCQLLDKGWNNQGDSLIIKKEQSEEDSTKFIPVLNFSEDGHLLLFLFDATGLYQFCPSEEIQRSRYTKGSYDFPGLELEGDRTVLMIAIISEYQTDFSKGELPSVEAPLEYKDIESLLGELNEIPSSEWLIIAKVLEI